MEIIMNELTYIENILETGNVSSKEIGGVASILTRYLYHEKGMSQTEIVEFMDQFFSKSCSSYNEATWYTSFLKYIRKAKGKPLHKIDFVPITEKEISAISSVKDEKKERLLFTLLCMAKYSNLRNETNNSWVNFENKEIFSQSHIRDSVAKRSLLIFDLKEQGFINNSIKTGNTNIQVTFMDGSSPIVYEVTEMVDLGYQYYLIRRKLSPCYQKGKNLRKCKECGHYFLGTSQSNNEGYCQDCKKKNEEVTVKTRTCMDCGREFPILSKDSRSKRCSQCKAKKKSEYDRIRYQCSKGNSTFPDEI